MAVLLIAEINNGKLALNVTAKAVSAAKDLGEITLLAAGGSVLEAAEEAARISGVSKVLVAEAEPLEHGLAEPMADLILSLAEGFEHILAPATTNFKNIMPRVASLLEVMVLTDVTEVVDASTFVRPVYAGNAMQTVRSRDPKKVMTVRMSNFSAAGLGERAEVKQGSTDVCKASSTWVEDKITPNDRPEMTSARIVVSGGRGVASKENFSLIEDLADTLGAAVGATRAAVDAGYAENDLQVGQTGKIVAPELYIAVGISGAIQHLAGMKDSKVIVAINQDGEAPIFDIADIGLVADLFEAVPELTKKLKTES